MRVRGERKEWKNGEEEEWGGRPVGSFAGRKEKKIRQAMGVAVHIALGIGEKKIKKWKRNYEEWKWKAFGLKINVKIKFGQILGSTIMQKLFWKILS